jgi:hypothetical protein
MRYIRLGFALCCAFVGFEFSPANAEKRVALVIGNTAYEHTRQLPNARHDAHAVAMLLTRIGFTVRAANDIAYRPMRETIRAFGELAQGAEIALVYYAGHGMEVAGENWLIPTSAQLIHERDLEYEAVSLTVLLRSVQGVSKFRLVVLDACRNNPLSDRLQLFTGTTRSVGRGLARIEPTGDILVAYSAKHGTLAQDGVGRNRYSPFARALLKHIAEPGLDIRLAFGRIRDDVLKATDSKQEPYIYGSLGGTNMSLVPAPPQHRPAPLVDVRGDYQLVERINTKKAWEVFIATHKTGLYVDLARERLRMLALADQKESKDATLAPKLGPTVPALEATKAWDLVKDSGDPATIRRFIERYPSSPLVNAAREVLGNLERATRERDEKAREKADRPAKAASPPKAARTERPPPAPKEPKRVANDPPAKGGPVGNMTGFGF